MFNVKYVLNYFVRIVAGEKESFHIRNIRILDSAVSNVMKNISNILIIKLFTNKKAFI
jgi:hypothetical protein